MLFEFDGLFIEELVSKLLCWVPLFSEEWFGLVYAVADGMSVRD